MLPLCLSPPRPARGTANGAPTPPIPAARNTRRSIKSTRTTPRICGSRGDSAPTTSARAPTTTCSRCRSWSNDVMYVQAGTRRTVVALDPTNGEMLWMWRMDEGKRGAARPASGLRPWSRLLDRRQGRRAHRHRHARVPHGGAQREDRHSGRVVRQERRRRSEDRARSAGHRSRDRRYRPQLAAGDRQQRHRRRRGAPARRRAAREGERQGLHPRLRRAHRQAPVDLPHDSAAGRVRQRHVGKRFVVVHRQRRQLGADHDRRRAQPRVPRDRGRHRRLLRRPSPRQQPLFRAASSASI